MAGYFQPVLLVFFPLLNLNLFLSPSCLTIDFSKEPLIKQMGFVHWFLCFSCKAGSNGAVAIAVLVVGDARWQMASFCRCSTMVLHSVWLGDCTSILIEKEEPLLTPLGVFL